MSYERPYYTSCDYRPYLYYVVFGANAEKMQLSRQRHHVDEIPKGIETYVVTRAQNADYMESVFGGTVGSVLRQQDAALYERCRKEDTWVLLTGEIEEDADLNYIRNCVGAIQALLETGGVGVLDLLTFSLYGAERFTEQFFGRSFNGYDHVSILLSEEENGEIWLHTRGMRKFGRPDVSIEHVDREELPFAEGVANQMIFYSIQGDFFPGKRIKLHPSPEESFIVRPELVDDLENYDFNNAYYKLLWEEVERIVS